MNKYHVVITEKLLYNVEAEANTAKEAEACACDCLSAGEYEHIKPSFGGIDCKAIENVPEVTMVGFPVLDVNNDRRIRLSQKVIDGPITVRTLSAPDDLSGHHRSIENEYEISAGDMVMLLNWYRFQKSHGNDDLLF